MISYFEKQLAELDHSLHSLDPEVFGKLVKESVEVLKAGHKVIVSGLGKNVPICDKFVGSMVSMGPNPHPSLTPYLHEPQSWCGENKHLVPWKP